MRPFYARLYTEIAGLVNLEAPVSYDHVPSPAATAIMIAALSTSVACASGGAREETLAAVQPVSDSSAVANSDGTIESLFAGRFPGVTVTSANGGGLRIRIRGGGNSFFLGDEPLYVVDDTPLPAGAGGIVFLNPYDIEKIEVLKNPSDTGVYGMRGSNGVIRITTKRPGH